MAEANDGVQPREAARESTQQAHEYVVEQVRDITREGKIVIEPGRGVDTAFRQLFPTTYDLVFDHPEARKTAEDE